MKFKGSWIVIVFILICGLSNIQAKSLHVTTDGKSRAKGDIDSPISLEWAFASLNRAGDTILIHGGDYYGNFTCWASGDEGNPMVVRPYNNEAVRIIGTGNSDLTLSLNGDWVEVHELIITQTARERVSSGDHSWPDDVNSERGIGIIGEGVKVINNIIHDIYGSGILGSGSNGVNAEVSGNIIFNTGWIGSDNGHGHGLYLQSNEGSKKATNNIVFNTYGHGFQFYTTGGQSLNGMDIEKNIAFNAGAPADPNSLGDMKNMMLGGDASVDNLTVKDNFTYFPSSCSGTSMQIGYNSVSESCRIEGNYIVGGSKVFVIYRFKSAVIQNNTIVGKDNELLASLFYPADESVRGNYDWNMNSYFADKELFYDANSNIIHDFDGWQDNLDFDRNSNLKSAAPMSNHVEVMSNQYKDGRGHVVIYNWENHNHVSVDLGDVLAKDDTYTIYDVENVFEPLLTGVYDGNSVRIPMELSKIIQPNGSGIYPVTHTSSEFGVFLVTSDSKRTVSTDVQEVPTETSEQSELIIYPNPSNVILNCEFYASQAGAASIQMFDLQGKKVMDRQESVFKGKNKAVLDVSNLNQGIYLLSVENEGQRTTAKVQIN